MSLDLEAAYAQHHTVLRRYAASRMGADAVDDALGAMWLDAVSRAAGYEDRGYPVSAWLYRILSSRIADEGRRLRRKAAAPLDGTEPATDTLDAVERRLDAQSALAARWERLTPGQQQVLILRYWHDLTNAEVAARLGTTLGAVKALHHRAVEVLRG